jgi:hypothetical protein
LDSTIRGFKSTPGFNRWYGTINRVVVKEKTED